MLANLENIKQCLMARKLNTYNGYIADRGRKVDGEWRRCAGQLRSKQKTTKNDRSPAVPGSK